jgi:hypothetical protein
MLQPGLSAVPTPACAPPNSPDLEVKHVAERVEHPGLIGPARPHGSLRLEAHEQRQVIQ